MKTNTIITFIICFILGFIAKDNYKLNSYKSKIEKQFPTVVVGDTTEIFGFKYRDSIYQSRIAVIKQMQGQGVVKIQVIKDCSDSPYERDYSSLPLRNIEDFKKL